jgi:creatinine amidohydrolase
VRYELMRPDHIRQAIREAWPAVLPVGVLEYHGEHLPLGMDGLVVTECLARLEVEMDLVVLPPFWYGAASYVVEGPEGKGSLHVDAEALVPVARQVFAALLRVGFRNIHFLIHHQTEKFAEGMPTDLAFRLAARQAVFAHLERERGEGWWGRPEAAGYYAAHQTGEDPFSWIRGHPLLSPDEIARYPFDHAGQGETSFMLALCPDSVDMAAAADGPWYTRTAGEASVELGEEGVRLVLGHLRRVLTRGRPDP